MPASNAPAPNSSPSPLRVLYVDDTVALRFVVAELLQKEGYVVETANDGIEAWEKVNESGPHFDLIITDFEMPRMDGLTLVDKLQRASFPGRVIVFSSPLVLEAKERFKSLGIHATVSKGTAHDELLKAVADAIGRPRSSSS